MKVYIEPNVLKYYETKVIGESDKCQVILSLSCDDLSGPSDRELAKYGASREDWERNPVVDNGWGGTDHLQNVLEFEASHTETRWCYELSQRITETIWKFLEEKNHETTKRS